MPNEKKSDIFDRIMSWKIFRPLQPFYKKYKEQLLYLFFGALTTVVSLGTYWLAYSVMGIPVLIANVFSWICAMSFAYITNRIWVFDSHASGTKEIIHEFFSFAVGRLATLGLEEVILWVGVEVLHCNAMVVKLIAQVLVVISNYIISKLFVFRKGESEAPEKK